MSVCVFDIADGFFYQVLGVTPAHEPLGEFCGCSTIDLGGGGSPEHANELRSDHFSFNADIVSRGVVEVRVGFDRFAVGSDV